jgi:hypothetical protein
VPAAAPPAALLTARWPPAAQVLLLLLGVVKYYYLVFMSAISIHSPLLLQQRGGLLRPPSSLAPISWLKDGIDHAVWQPARTQTDNFTSSSTRWPADVYRERVYGLALSLPGAP